MAVGVTEETARRLADACTVVDAAEAAMEACLEAGYALPSIYLERGGRLRCVAQRGYWQVFDGLAPGAGVLGTAFQRGATQVMRNPTPEDDFIRAIPSVRSEVCVPLMVDGQPAGALNVESRSILDDDDVVWVEGLAAALSRRFAELGGRPIEGPAEMLARFAYELACLDDRDRVMRHTLTAAVSVSGMRGACLFLAHEGHYAAAADSGRLGRRIATLGEDDVRQLADYVSRATSSYAVGDGEGDGFEATHVLRDSGVGSLVVLALMANGRREGVLVLVDAQPRPGIPELIPLMEMLAATSAAMIAAAESKDALQRSERTLAHRARHDPLTGLANRSGLLEVLREELADDARRAAAVVLFVDLDGFKDVNDQYGHRAGDQLLAAVADRLRNAARDSDLVARLGGDEFVVLCTKVSDLSEATAVGERIMERLASPFRLGTVTGSITACIGIARAEGRGTAEDVIAAADRAMYAAKDEGQGRWVLADPAA
jgi:diguanylate cyclase (GGDEF)-like protein